MTNNRPGLSNHPSSFVRALLSEAAAKILLQPDRSARCMMPEMDADERARRQRITCILHDGVAPHAENMMH